MVTEGIVVTTPEGVLIVIRRTIALAVILAALGLWFAVPVLAQDSGYPTPEPTFTETIPPTVPPTQPPTEPPTEPPTVPPTQPPTPTDSPRPTPSVPPLDPPQPPPDGPTLAVTGLALGSGAAAAVALIGGGTALVRAAGRRSPKD